MNFGYRSRRVQTDVPQPPPPPPPAPPHVDESDVHDSADLGKDEPGDSPRRKLSSEDVAVDQEPSLIGDCKRNYLNRHYHHPSMMKTLQKQGDNQVLFADRVLKFTGSGKMKQRILLISDFAIYMFDPDNGTLKRRIALAAVENMCVSKLNDNFFAVIVPTEYDLLMVSTRKTEIVTVLVEATQSASNYELEVVSSNSFEYNAAAELVKEVQFEEVEGGVKTRIARK